MAERLRLFGTDGIRGRVPYGPLAAASVVRLGQAIAEVAREAGIPPLVVVGRDTRRSGPFLEAALTAGLLERGLDVLPVGVIPTPGIAWLTRRYGAGLGVMISASHNPYPDNGIKILAQTGFKIADEVEQEIERLVEEGIPPVAGDGWRVGTVMEVPEAPEEVYLSALLSRAGGNLPLRGWHLVVDCAHGATYRVAPELFRRLGARVTVLHAEPDGENINRGCGSEHPEALQETVRQTGASAGIALDGDGDRVMLVDEGGKLLDGDAMLYILARDLQAAGRLRGGVVVGTVMANLGLEKALEEMGVRLERTPVGDRYVAQRMLEGNWVLGGEPSGHVVIFGEGSTTGDGLYTALKVLGMAAREGRPLSALASGFRPFPQVVRNVPVMRRPPLSAVPELVEAEAVVRKRLGSRGRVLLRYSGTQPLLRVMVEGEDEAEVTWAAGLLAEVGERVLGGGKAAR
ncbi:MAG: phosphoglucosamine mutase [Chloroflexia bacterium]